MDDVTKKKQKHEEKVSLSPNELLLKNSLFQAKVKGQTEMMKQLQDFINQCNKDLCSMGKMNTSLFGHRKKLQESFTKAKDSRRHIQGLLDDSQADAWHYKAKVAKLEKKLKACRVMCR